MFNKYNFLDSDVLIFDTKNDNYEVLLSYFSSYLTKEELKKIESYQILKDKICHLISYVIPKIELGKKLNINPKEILIIRKDNERPYYKDYDYYYSISHSDTYVAFVLSNKNIAVDIETRQIRDLKALEYVASEDEIEETSDYDSKYQLWTFKEAYAKYTGKGIGRYLKDIKESNIDLLHQTIFINHLVITLIKEK